MKKQLDACSYTTSRDTTAESPLKTLCRQRTLPNFKESTAIRLGEIGRLEEIA